MALRDIVEKLVNHRIKPAGDGRWMSLCPAHEDSSPSLAVARGTGGNALVHCHAGCSAESVVEALGLKLTDLFDEEAKRDREARETLAPDKWPITSTYTYENVAGQPAYRVLRLTSPDSGAKTFRQQRFVDGRWVAGMDGVDRVLYKLPRLLEPELSDEIVFLAEGERDADNLAELGLLATTNVGGAGKWLQPYCEALRKRHVVVLPDNDEPGEKHAALVTKALEGIAASVRVLRLPGLPPKGDVTDWIGGGGTAEQLRAMAARLAAGAMFMPSPQRLIGERADRLQAARSLLSFGVSFLDQALGGITRRDLVLVGAKTGTGKTQLALNIAIANCRMGRKVHYFALEAEERELERRLKFQLLADAYFRNRGDHSDTADVRYVNWYNGTLDAELARYEDAADRKVAEITRNLRTYYRIDSFTGEDFARHLGAIRDETDLVVLDHFHYVDTEDENEIRAQRKLVKLIRDSVLRADRPVIVVGHVRKSDPRQAALVPSEEAFHGSADLIRIATKAVMIAADHETQTAEPTLWSTYMRVVKCRQDSSVTRYCARIDFDTRTDRYNPEYQLGRLVDGDRLWEPVMNAKWPGWKRRPEEMQ